MLLLRPAGLSAILDPNSKQRKAVDYFSQFGPLLRDIATNVDDENERNQTLVSLAQGFPNQAGSQQVDVQIFMYGWDPLTTMQQRKCDGFPWVPAYGMNALPATNTGIVTADPVNIPFGAIIVTTDFKIVSPDLILTAKPFSGRSAPSPDPNDVEGVGATYWPMATDLSSVLAEWTDGTKRYKKVDLVGYMGVTQRLYVRLA